MGLREKCLWSWAYVHRFRLATRDTQTCVAGRKPPAAFEWEEDIADDGEARLDEVSIQVSPSFSRLFPSSSPDGSVALPQALYVNSRTRERTRFRSSLPV